MLLALVASVLPITVRMGSVSIVPPEPLPLGGYTERRSALFEPGGDDLQASALVLSQGETTVAIVSAEMLTIPESLNREVARRLPGNVQLILAATHTHSAPDSQMLNERMTFAVPGIATFRRRWLDWYADRLAEAVRSTLALPPRQAGPFRLRRAELDLNQGRRSKAMPDRAAHLLTAEIDGVETPLLASYAAHPVLYGPEERRLRGDWIGSSMMALGCPVLTGPIGDVSPVGTPLDIPRYVAALNRLRRARVIWREASPDLDFFSAPIELGRPQPHPEFARVNRIPESLAQSLVERFAPQEGQVRGVRLGKFCLLGVPGEPTAALAGRIAAQALRSGFGPVLVASHVGGWIGYVLEPDDYARGGYEATLAFHGPQVAGALVQAARQACHAAVRSRTARR